ncbi:MKRN2 opposite strand protein [Carassius auratus]|uniref:MKRN2 opposite strand protein n=1 Tax=Carassius auratus TaxID=7957 RepID=A0A6P6MJ66_CARAU|nr:MKRN2 opposite strand protein-like [Carassius auratus]XP_052425304.1 MKRN2 opposite strand protein [Carassius gibelio]
MDQKSVIRLSHCDKDIYCFFVPDQCPECGVSFSGKRLEEAPVSVPSPFSNGHKEPCAFLVTSTDVLRDFDGSSDLHTGISNTSGTVYSYTRSGVQRESQGWERCVCVPLVHTHMFSLRSQWDQYLEQFSSAHTWDPASHSFDEESHNCYSFSLMFINCVLATQSKPALSKDEFTRSFVLPRIKRASKYMMLCREISQNHFYIVDSTHRDSGQGPSEDDDSKNK